jgi:SAM-dependent methyltransferase
MALDQYLKRSWRPNAPDPESAAIRRRVVSSGLFDPDYYRVTYPDVAQAGCDLLDHFCQHGIAENRRPGPGFDPQWYLAANPDVGASGTPAFLHYLRHGASEGRYPLPLPSAAPALKPTAAPPHSPEEVLNAQQLQEIKARYALAGQPDFLLRMNAIAPFRGKRVLEIGGSNMPKELIFDRFGARQWISVDRVYPENRQYWPIQYSQTGVIPISRSIDYFALDRHVILDGRVENLPASFAGQFDLVVSMDAFEHIHRFATMLDLAYSSLRPGGQMLSMYSVIWSAHFGHHLWGVTDKAGRTYYIESSPIPPWGHLLMTPPQMYRYLLDHTDAETADEIVWHVYHSEILNRLFYEDYEEYLRGSRFKQWEMGKFIPDVEPDDATRARLEALYPGRKQFGATSIFLIAQREEAANEVL